MIKENAKMVFNAFYEHDEHDYHAGLVNSRAHILHVHTIKKKLFNSIVIAYWIKKKLEILSKSLQKDLSLCDNLSNL